MRPSIRLFQRAVARQTRQNSNLYRPSSLIQTSHPIHTPSRSTAPSISRIFPLQSQARYTSSSAVTPHSSETKGQRPSQQEPSYKLTFTCKPCKGRSSHNVTKHGYHKGTVLITCPDCKSRHIISDHLKIFMDEASTLEDILAKKLEQGQDLTKLLKKGRLGMRQGQMVANEGDEDIEFWDDGSQTVHEKPNEGAKL